MALGKWETHIETAMLELLPPVYDALFARLGLTPEDIQRAVRKVATQSDMTDLDRDVKRVLDDLEKQGPKG